MIVDKMTTEEMAADKMTFGEMTKDTPHIETPLTFQRPIDKTSVEKMTVDKMSFHQKSTLTFCHIKGKLLLWTYLKTEKEQFILNWMT